MVVLCKSFLLLEDERVVRRVTPVRGDHGFLLGPMEFQKPGSDKKEVALGNQRFHQPITSRILQIRALRGR